MKTDHGVSISSKIILIFIGLLGVAIALVSCAQSVKLKVSIPTEPAAGCEHIPLNEVLPGHTTKEKSYRIEQQRNDKLLIPGQKVPDFTLVNLEGEEVSLFKVLEESNTVLVDFWASWCGPCVANFPKLKELRNTYGEEGFEVVTISVDTSHEDWSTGSVEHEIPWINLGELESWDGEVATMYGVHFIPKSYLVDGDGCILQKDLPIDLLEEVIISKFDEAVDEESSPETDL
ncbi:MAG: TlpA family protein disulfide reductase [Gammaproteobacteria bacterium]|nr:TlpA family protein disulfide reductase [Gammaproteobacteria bacterium]MYF38645.1 TlpA family protein disulfide reductase [Gammaproteobacteria bacterium]